VGEKESEPIQFTFNGFLKVAFQGSRGTSDAGLILVRELDERLGLEAIIAARLRDSRQGLNTQFPLPDLLRQSIYSRLAGYEDLNDAARLSTDPTFRLIGSPKRWDRSAALTSTLHWFETELLTREENHVGLMAVNRDLRIPQECSRSDPHPPKPSPRRFNVRSARLTPASRGRTCARWKTPLPERYRASTRRSRSLWHRADVVGHRCVRRDVRREPADG
jgi:hypothetical protein